MHKTSCLLVFGSLFGEERQLTLVLTAAEAFKGLFNKLLGNGALHKEWREKKWVDICNGVSVQLTVVFSTCYICDMSRDGCVFSQGLVLHFSFDLCLLQIWGLTTTPCWSMLELEGSYYAWIIFTPQQAWAGKIRFILRKNVLLKKILESFQFVQ